MNEELLQEAMRLFNSADKWNAFLELSRQSDTIQKRWWKKLQDALERRSREELSEEWDVCTWDAGRSWDVSWYLKGESNDTFSIHFWDDCFRVIGFSGLNPDKVKTVIKEPKFNLIKTCFERVDGSDDQTIAWEHRNFSFGTDMDGYFPNGASLARFAGNKTDEFADQVLRKVKRFQTPEVIALFREINERCKRDI